MLEMRPTGDQKLSQGEIQEYLRQMRTDARRDNPRVLGIHMRNLIIAKNNGYPVMLYHEQLEAVEVRSEEEEMALSTQGFQRTYIRKDYPKHLHRRNMAKRFAPELDPSTADVRSDRTPFVESRVVRSKEEEEKLHRALSLKGEGKWYRTLGEVDEHDPLSTETVEDVRMELARAQGELSARREAEALSRKK